MTLQQIKPAKARKKIETDEELAAVMNRNFIAEEKMDGARYKLHTFEEVNRIDSRRESEIDGLYVEKTDNVPHIRDQRLPPGWVVDSEIIARHGVTSHDKCANTVSIMGSLPDRSAEVQRTHGTAVMYAFDVIKADGEDVRMLPLAERLKYLDKFMSFVDQEHIRRMPFWTDPADFQGAFNHITQVEKGEGLMIKDLRASYDATKAWFKKKRFFPMDVVTTGKMENGKGKYKGLLGAVKFGLFNAKGELREVGQCSGMSDNQRVLLTEQFHAGTLGGQVMEIRALDITKTGKVRNATFVRMRLDKNASECTIELQLDPHRRR